MMLVAQAQTWMLTLAATAPTPGEELPFNPDDVTPGPLGFFVFIFVAVATGLLVMDLIRRTSRVQARARIREQLQAEVAAGKAADAAAAAGPAGSGAVATGDAHPDGQAAPDAEQAAGEKKIAD
ncbi:hypothetical protein [Pseudoclavibacter sp. JSM 162008]|uniref:hypothetical protein n=1 Tax=Pseudoclavibacter sp. JSM 162008 TaxID=3229855 RepID=UPI0035262779